MKRYADDYEVVVKKDSKGRDKKIAVYRGIYFEITLSQEQLNKYRVFNLFLLFSIIIVHMVGGFVANQGMYQFYIVLPYVLTFLPIYLLTVGIFRLPKEKRLFRRDEVGLSFKRMKTATIIFLILSGIGIVGEIVFLIWFAKENLTLEIVFLGLLLLELMAGYLLLRLRQSLQIEQKDDKSEK